MATLVSPGVSVTVTDESFFIPAQASTVPLFFIASRANKLQPNNITPAVGTMEHGVVRTVTSINQSLELYGVPYFWRDIAGNEFHGDSRNEYGLFALNQFLGVGNRAFVVRANIDTTDEPISYPTLGTPAAISTSFNGLGNGVLGTVTATSNQVRPQTISITFTSSTNFTVTGSISGYVGVGVVGTPFASTVVNFTVTAGLVPFATGDKFTVLLGYVATPGITNVGNGEVVNLVPDVLAETLITNETVTITFTTPTQFDVVGSGPSGSLTGQLVNTPVDFNNYANFMIVPGTTPFQAGDEFTFVISQVNITSPLGSNDAQRRLAITTALQAAINSNTEVRSPLYEFNIVLCPGYPEVVDELIALSTDVKEEALVLADTPANQTPDQVAQWALTSSRFVNNKVAYYYPWGVGSNIDGRNVLCAPSGIALRTITYSDNVAYVWTAPAGVSRGVVTGISQVGYYTGTPGTPTTFVEVSLNEGQRDNLYDYDKNINPIVFFPGRGLLIWGQKTSAPAASALDRINVARLVMYLRRALRKGALPFVFEPNDKITRDNLKAAADGILNDILVKRGLVDYATVCDATNNTPDRVDRNELWLDVAIKPTKAAEFIYIPIRVVAQVAEI
jgi:hypothetical protein